MAFAYPSLTLEIPKTRQEQDKMISSVLMQGFSASRQRRFNIFGAATMLLQSNTLRFNVVFSDGAPDQEEVAYSAQDFDKICESYQESSRIKEVRIERPTE